MIQTNWAELVHDTILKATRLPMYPLPYGLFLSKVFEYYKLDFVEENSIVLNHNKLIEVNALHYMSIFQFDNGWAFKDEPPKVTKLLTYHNIDDEDAEVDPDNVTNDTDHVDIDQDEATNKDDTPDEEADDIDTTTTATNDDEDSTQDEMFD
ncbi:hypothetical protein DEO72_LG5g2567 [Vigna unguiculata]|uniref:Uncharacterized protein n=1 Tax=Vigna unguiculata TaxID=3917 RepID=A0A4D6M131_VIGUN|nr:hypothetical protein DEO72_LG5g2567 [Vigna unguiculata]